MKDRLDALFVQHTGNRHALALRLLALLLLGLPGGCATPQPASDLMHPADFMRQRYGFIADGQTTREEVLLRMGIPAAKFEGDRILAYQLVPALSGAYWYIRDPVRDSETGMRVWADNTCSLIFVFDSNGVLERHSLVLPHSFKETYDP